MSELQLRGCRPDPLMSYLKALGVFRLVSEQKDIGARGRWRDDIFVLQSQLDEEALIQFMLEKYSPTPIVVPWSGNDFFSVVREPEKKKFTKTPSGSKIIEAFITSQGRRLAPYRQSLQITLELMDKLGLTKQKIKGGSSTEKKTKVKFLATLRSNLPEEVVPWIDAAALMAGDSPKFNSLLGSGGGNDGNCHFSDNFMQNLWDCLPEFDNQKGRSKYSWSERAVRASLFHENCNSLVRERTASLFAGGAVGGPNATQGMNRGPMINPWDFILAIEGSLCFAGAVARRQQTGADATPGFPFSVRLVIGGNAGLVLKEIRYKKVWNREVWLPLWNRPINFRELKLLFSEGRAQIGTRYAKNGTDFARAVAGLGVDKGIGEFARFGILKGRLGENHAAFCLGRFPVAFRPEINLLGQIEQWLETYRRRCSDGAVPNRFVSALRRLDDAVLGHCQYGGKSRFSAILSGLGRIEKELALLGGRIGSGKIQPIPPLSTDWISACDNSRTEFRIAVALASILRADKDVGPLRTNLEPVEIQGSTYKWSEKWPTIEWSWGNLSAHLIEILEYRLIDSEGRNLEHLPLSSSFAVSVQDIALFLSGQTDDGLIREFLRGAILVHYGSASKQVLIEESPGYNPIISRAYALLKLLFLPKESALRSVSDGRDVRPEPAILALLRAGYVEKACALATRRLRSSGFVAMPGPMSGGRGRRIEYSGKIHPLRLAAALLIPVMETNQLKQLVLRKPQ